MSEADYSLTIKLTPLLKNYLKMRGEMMGQNMKEVVRYALVKMMEQDKFETLSNVQSTSESTAESIVDPIFTAVPIQASVVRSTAESTSESVVDQTSSRALHNDIYILDNNNNINIIHKGLLGVWNDFVQFKKEQRKPIKPMQLKKLWAKFGKIISEHGVDGLIASINQTIERGYQGVFPVDSQPVVTDNTKHCAEDF